MSVEIKKKLLISYWLTVNDSILVKQNKKPIKSIRGLAIILKEDFLGSTDSIYRKLKRLEEEGYGKTYKKTEIEKLIPAICKLLNVSEDDLFGKLAADETC